MGVAILGLAGVLAAAALLGGTAGMRGGRGTTRPAVVAPVVVSAVVLAAVLLWFGYVAVSGVADD